MKNMKQRAAAISRLEQYMRKNNILFEQIHKIEYPYAAETAMDYFHKSGLEFCTYHIYKDQRIRKAYNDIEKYLVSRNCENTVILLLFLYEKPHAYSIALGQEAWQLIHEHLIADWAIFSPDFRTVIYADQHERTLVLSENINSKLSLRVTVQSNTTTKSQ